MLRKAKCDTSANDLEFEVLRLHEALFTSNGSTQLTYQGASIKARSSNKAGAGDNF